MIEFPDGELLLSDVGALFAEHRSTVTYKAAEPNKPVETNAQATADKRLSAVKPSKRTDINLHVGCIVTHKIIGQGRVIRIDGQKITIRFFQIGVIKDFSRDALEKKGLLTIDR